jgi:hypothetical protein
MRIRYAAAKALLAACVLAVAARGGDMTLDLGNGVEVFLHEDSSWSYKERPAKEIDEDQYITVDRGQIIMIGVEGNWRFVDGKQAKEATTKIVYETMFASGMSESKVHREADAKAMEMAIGKMVTKLRKAVGSKVSSTLVKKCLMMQDGVIEKQETFGKLWRVTVKISLDDAGVKRIIACSQEYEEKPAEGGAKGAAGKSEKAEKTEAAKQEPAKSEGTEAGDTGAVEETAE